MKLTPRAASLETDGRLRTSPTPRSSARMMSKLGPGAEAARGAPRNLGSPCRALYSRNGAFVTEPVRPVREGIRRCTSAPPKTTVRNTNSTKRFFIGPRDSQWQWRNLRRHPPADPRPALALHFDGAAHLLERRLRAAHELEDRGGGAGAADGRATGRGEAVQVRRHEVARRDGTCVGHALVGRRAGGTCRTSRGGTELLSCR